MSLDPVLVEEVEVGHRSAVEAEVEVPGPLQPPLPVLPLSFW